MSLETNAYRRAWAEWLPGALPLLEEENYAEALKTFPKPPAPELPLLAAPPAALRRYAFVTSAGAYDTVTQSPFTARSAIGDTTPRFFPLELPDDQLAFAHGHYDQEHVEADREVLLPRRAFAEAGAALASTIHSFMGYNLDWPSFIESTIPQFIAMARAQAVNCAILVPV
jgi:hypothetical protein